MSVSLQELSASFYRLRALPSAFSVSNDAERTWVPEVDTFQGEKHQVMLGLQGKLGQPGIPAQRIFENMGQPDELTAMPPDQNERAADDDAMLGITGMPGPVMVGSEGLNDATTIAPPIYAIYYWRGKHDYLWFKLDSAGEEVLTSGWYHAFE